MRDGVFLPVAFYSRQLRAAEKRYSATELEALAILSAVAHFSHFLFGREFVVYTDHKALVAFRSSKVLNRRLQGWTLRYKIMTSRSFTARVLTTGMRMISPDKLVHWSLKMRMFPPLRRVFLFIPQG